MTRWIAVGIGMVTTAAVVAAAAAENRPELVRRLMTLTRASSWTPVRSIPLAFRVHHPQGMVRIGEHFYISSVEIRRPTRRYPSPVDGMDRDAGEGTGHLFRTDGEGRLLADVTLGEGSLYHPGGIDYDGTHIWVPVAEYRPDSRSIVYRVDPRTLEVTEVFRFADHLGALAVDTEHETLHAVSWGSRRFYTWTLDAGGRVTDAQPRRTLNPAHYVDYQDCAYAGGGMMLCTGIGELRGAPGMPSFRLGGMELVNLADGRPVHQVPVARWTTDGLPMTRNAVWFEVAGDGLRAYFLPEDDTASVHVFDVK